MFGLAIATMLASPCRTLIVKRASGEAVAIEDTIAAPCSRPVPLPKLRLDPVSQRLVAKQDLQAGAPLGPVLFSTPPAIAVGDRVAIVARIGHTMVARKATALQPARDGQRFFVRTDDGAVFAAPAVGGGR